MSQFTHIGQLFVYLSEEVNKKDSEIFSRLEL